MWSFVTLLTTSNLERPPFRRRTDAPTAGAAWEFAQGTCQKETLQVHSSAVPGPFSTDRVPLHARLCGLPDAVPTTFGYAVVVELWRPKVRLREGPPYLGAPSRPVLDFRIVGGGLARFAQGTCQEETLQPHSGAVPGPFDTDRVPLDAA